MKKGLPKIDKNMKELVSKALLSGRWHQVEGGSHRKLVMTQDRSKFITVAGSSSDPHRATLNLRADIRRREREAGYTEFSV